MTRNQVAYHDLIERIRSNKANEAEKLRSNVQKEFNEAQANAIKAGELAHKRNYDTFNAGMKVVDTLKDVAGMAAKIKGGTL